MKKFIMFVAFAALLAVTGCNEKQDVSKDVVSFDEIVKFY